MRHRLAADDKGVLGPGAPYLVGQMIERMHSNMQAPGITHGSEVMCFEDVQAHLLSSILRTLSFHRSLIAHGWGCPRARAADRALVSQAGGGRLLIPGVLGNFSFVQV